MVLSEIMERLALLHLAIEQGSVAPPTLEIATKHGLGLLSVLCHSRLSALFDTMNDIRVIHDEAFGTGYHRIDPCLLSLIHPLSDLFLDLSQRHVLKVMHQLGHHLIGMVLT